MEFCSRDFIEWIGRDMSVKVLMCLEDPSDLVGLTAVSSYWRQFVIENELCKQLCRRMFPRLSDILSVEIESSSVDRSHRTESSKGLNVSQLEHRAYSSLAHALASVESKVCMLEAVSASSTDNDPDENIQNTLLAGDMFEERASYWSSKGESDPEVPETLVYKLQSSLCIVTEIHVQPFRAYFQFGFPIYSAKAVRFRLGRPKFSPEHEKEETDESPSGKRHANDAYVWTYTSPVFPMIQRNRLQKFQLPEPAICIGGILQVELLGRAQKQEMDGLYYLCVSHVKAVGKPLDPAFSVSIMDHHLGTCTLKYNPEVGQCSSHKDVSPKSEERCASSRVRAFTARLVERGVRGWEHVMLGTLMPNGNGILDVDYDESDDDYNG